LTFLINFVDTLFQVLFLAIFARILLSWFPIRPGNPFFQLTVILNQITEPILGPFRRVIPTIGMIDISPMVALFVLRLVHQAVIGALISAVRSAG
jgi:YggT family protein